jgi:hypothetical protein
LLPRERLSNLASSFENTQPGGGEDLHWNEGLSKQHEIMEMITLSYVFHNKQILNRSYFWKREKIRNIFYIITTVKHAIWLVYSCAGSGYPACTRN